MNMVTFRLLRALRSSRRPYPRLASSFMIASASLRVRMPATSLRARSVGLHSVLSWPRIQAITFWMRPSFLGSCRWS